MLLIIAVHATRWLSPGLQITEYRETFTRGAEPVQAVRVFYQPYPAAWGYLALGTLTALGVIRRRWLSLAWVGLLGLAVWSGLWLFSSGAAFLPYAGLLAILMIVITVTWPDPARQRP